ncbi:uncharacterized protein LOC143040405 isoform X2 [Oratosquilla oratoria]
MGNLICVLNHCWGRGAEVVMGDTCHIHLWEQGGIAQLGGVHPRTVKNKPDGTFCIEEMTKIVRQDNPHYPITTLVCVENTHNASGGKVLPLEWLDQLGRRCQELGLPLHMDGARMMNAATALNVPPARLVRHVTTVSLCLSKGLGAPVGSVIAGPKDFILRAIRLRKVLGGGMRQSGMLAAAGIYALDYIAPMLSQDHAHAKQLAEAVQATGSDVVKVDLDGVHTNIVLMEVVEPKITTMDICNRMATVSKQEEEELGEKIVAKMLPITNTAVRMVTHCNLTHKDIAKVVKKLTYVLNELNIIK